jgi:hypothetical protein
MSTTSEDENFAIENLAAQLESANVRGSEARVLIPFRFTGRTQNQFIFFFKPEVFGVHDVVRRRAIIDLTFRKLEEYDISITGAATLSGPFLDGASAMDRHYGYINITSRRASNVLSDEEKQATRTASGAADNARIIGGHEYLLESGITAHELDGLWRRQVSAKVRSGLYVEQMDLNGSPVVVVNGFHPAQLEHFTGSDRMIAVMLLDSELPWSIIRSRLIGDTFPEKAARGSIRREIYDSAESLGLGTVSIANNCVHLSAGPFEGYFEMANFLGDIPEVEFDQRLPTVARFLNGLGLGEQLEHVRGNPGSALGSLFDLTEGLDTESAVHLYARFFTQKSA